MELHDEIAKILSDRMREQGLDVPRFHAGYVPPLPSDREFRLSNGDTHDCDDEKSITLPLVLVVDVGVTMFDNGRPHGRVFKAKERFDPYWLGDASIMHDWVPYPKKPFRPVNPIEALCIFAQHPRLGSVKSNVGFGHWGHTSYEVYRCPQRNRIVLANANHTGYHHHAGFVRYTIGSMSPEIHSIDPDPLPRPPSNGGET